MPYLQSVFATRFNRYSKENGHVFEGRYHSPLVGEGYQEIKLSRQEALVKREMKRLKKTETDVKQDLKGAK